MFLAVIKRRNIIKRIEPEETIRPRVHGDSLGKERDSTVLEICKAEKFLGGGSKRMRELWMVKVVQQVHRRRCGRGESEIGNVEYVLKAAYSCRCHGCMHV